MVINVGLQAWPSLTLITPQQNYHRMPATLLQYRNGAYHGQTKSSKRHGYGLLLTDTNTIIASQWKNDAMTGKGLVFTSPEQYGYGEFNRGEIEGHFIFRAKDRTLFGEYNVSKPVNRMVLIDYGNRKVQVLVHKSPVFEVLEERAFNPENEDESSLIYTAIGVRFPCYSLVQFLRRQICPAQHAQQPQQHNHFTLKPLPNGNTLFCFQDPSSPCSLGFTLNKNEQMVSCGMYTSDRLSGIGCKYDNGVRIEGMFEGGVINGVGLKYSQGKYSFGHFENGNLMEALYIDDRTQVSEEKLMEFKKLEHIRSLDFQNSYIRRIPELQFELNTQQEYMYPQVSTLLNSVTGKKNNSLRGTNYAVNNNTFGTRNGTVNNQSLNTTANKNLALNLMMKRQGDKLETKSSKEFFLRPSVGGSIGRNQYGNTNDKANIEFNQDSRVIENYMNSNGRGQANVGNQEPQNNLAPENDSYYKNPEDFDQFGESRASRGLRNLRKFKY